MNSIAKTYDAVVIGSGPSGQNAAIAAAGLGAKTLIVEREINVGGACVQYGTIPSKTLRETAVAYSSFREKTANVYEIAERDDLRIDSLTTRLHQVVETHQATTRRLLDFSGVDIVRGKAEFTSANEILIKTGAGEETVVQAKRVFIAVGSRPRDPDEIPIDHENILDSDSILSMSYLPRSMTIQGGGVIACEYASIFASLGVRVVVVDRYPKPLGFLDADLVAGFLDHFESVGGRFVGEQTISEMTWDGVSSVVTKLSSGEEIISDKAFVAAGRVANTDTLQLEKAGLSVNERSLISVNAAYQTDNASIYAIGDAIGPPSLASSSMHQGRAAARHAFGTAGSHPEFLTPMGIYTIPEISCVGLDEGRAKKEHGEITIGRADFAEVARGQIMAAQTGFLKLICDAHGKELLGVQVLGEGATELIHIAQLAMMSNMSIDEVAMTNFNFPTLAEAYRLAAIDILDQRRKRRQASETSLHQASEELPASTGTTELIAT